MTDGEGNQAEAQLRLKEEDVNVPNAVTDHRGNSRPDPLEGSEWSILDAWPNCPIKACERAVYDAAWCTPIFLRVYIVEKHLRISHQRLSVCPGTSCGHVFLLVADLQAHMHREHSDLVNSAISLQCWTCHKMCVSLSGFEAHVDEHHASKARSHCYWYGGPICPCVRPSKEKNPLPGDTHSNHSERESSVSVYSRKDPNFKAECKEEEIKLYSVEHYSFAERRLLPPRDSVEPQNISLCRNTDEAKYGSRMRNTDELMHQSYGNPRGTDELAGMPFLERLRCHDDLPSTWMYDESRTTPYAHNYASPHFMSWTNNM